MKLFKLLVLFLFVQHISSCSTAIKKEPDMDQQLKKQLTVIDSLLRNADFSLNIAKSQDTAYYKGLGQAVPPFLTPEEDTATVKKTAREEKIATNLAGFYALECGVDLLSYQTKEKPTDLLEKIVTGKADSSTVLLLNRFANATWKTGQPFRDLERITRPTFTVASFLPEEEIVKDYNQVKTAAVKLLSSLQAVKDSSAEGQKIKIRSLLHSQPYAFEMAAYMDSGYYAGLHQPVPPFISAKEDSTIIRKSVKDQKIATNVAGFYALECGINYLVTTRKILPSAILASIADNSISAADKNLFSRFANATWKASQPFRGLNRIERETFTVFHFLNEADVEKDWVQIKAAAKKLQAHL
ncbi:MAG: hypothetical protein ABIQ88_08900 [Chitinophagaceae bacterium]